VPAGNYQIIVRDAKLCADTVEVTVPGSGFLFAPPGSDREVESAKAPAVEDIPPPAGSAGKGANSTASTGILLFPNPASGEVKLLIDRPFEQGVWYIFDTQGRLVSSRKFDHSEAPLLDVSGLPGGLYLVKVQIEGEQFSRRLVVSERR
jgi:hypothetical protein